MSMAKHEPWAQEVRWAKAICALLDCEVAPSTAMFELAKIKGDGISLVLYPHKTSASNYHIRVRDNGSKDKVKADRVMDALDHGDGLPKDEGDRVRFSCT